MAQKPTPDTAFRKTEQSVAVRAVRGGLVNMIPVLIIGAFALIFNTFPLTAYQRFLDNTSVGGWLRTLFQSVNSATFGVLSLYMTYSISRSYMKIKADPDAVNGGAVFASLLTFFILSGAYLPGFGTDSLGPKSMFLAILTGLGASALYLRFDRLLRARRLLILTKGADQDFNRMLSSLFPITLVAIVFAVFNLLVMRLFGVESFRMLLIETFNWLFSHGKVGFFKGFFFVLFSSVLWFFGIHGSDTLEEVMQTYFASGLAENQAAVAAGGEPTAILCKQFFDCFVLMGGCGATICLLIAILLFSRNRARRGLGLTASFSMIFNINELMVFGLPIILNPTMLIPFLAVPLVCYSVAYAAIASGLVPMITGAVEWTTPILLGGYHATGSIAGSLLQLVNVALGVLIYTPFVRKLDRESEAAGRARFREFTDYYIANEADFAAKPLTALNNQYGDFAKELCADLKEGMETQLTLAYQPQYGYDGRCIGAEALLRWKHPVHGAIYPPLLIKLAEECGILPDLEETIFNRALAERPDFIQRFGPGIKLSVNVTGTTIVSPRFLEFLRERNETYHFAGKNLCLEVTEQAYLSFSDASCDALRAIRAMGLQLAIDDFSMGQTSIQYLKNNLFDVIKIDGSLVRGLSEQKNCREIIRSVTQLADTLGLDVIAEYVETAEQRDELHEIGCDCYQGWLYSPAVFLDDLDK